MQNAALGEPESGDVDVIGLAEWQFGQYGVAVVTMLVNGILAIGEMIPDRVRQELELIPFWPARNLGPVAVIFTDYFLQKDQVWCRLPEFTANRFQRITAVTE